jgi:hypothetical protein
LDSFALVMMPMTGTADVACGAQQIHTNPATGAVVSPTLPFFQTIQADCDQIMIQVDRFGTSIGTALRTQSDTMRTRRRQLAE